MKKNLVLRLALLLVLVACGTSSDTQSHLYRREALTLHLPFEPQAQTLPWPEEVLESVSEITSDQYVDTRSNLVFTVNYARYRPGHADADIHESVDGAITHMQSLPTTEKMEYEVTPLERNGVEGLDAQGSLWQQGKEFAFHNLAFARGQELWQIIVIYRANEQQAERTVSQILETISFTD